jgi:two-component system, NarL family, sensor histidine kinase DesK
MRRYPFLPPDSRLGWTPYAWLIYLFFFVAEPLFASGRPPWEYAADAAVLAAFLPLYFWGYWQRGLRALRPALGCVLLGSMSVHWNGGAAVFFIYGAGFLGAIGRTRTALWALAGLVVWVAAEAWWVGAGWTFWLIAIVFSGLVAGINIHYAEVARRDDALRRSQEEVERLAQVAERERIGRDLHDLLGHTLSLITLKSELAGKLLARQDGGRAAASHAAVTREVADIERISRRALSEVRQAVQGYRSGGLAAELEHAAATLASAGLECRRTVDDEALAAATAEPARERVLSFVLREAVTNVLRHAAAAHCELSLTLAGGELRLGVADDGRGGAAPDGFGLSGMRERLAALGGRVERDGVGGTRLLAAVPLAAAAEAEPRRQSALRPAPAAGGPGGGAPGGG